MWRCVLLALLLLSGPLQAEPVTLTLPSKLTARAEYRQGQPGKPAVLILHGFLQTHQFATVANLANGLHGEGYTVLTPTLTLGVSHRRQSMACKAIHTHTLQQDDAEITSWLAWLKKRHAGGVVLVGHSMGSVILLPLAQGKVDPAIRKYIGISMVEGRQHTDGKLHELGVEQMRKAQREGRQLAEMPLSFCHPMRGTPASLLSYLEWTPERILQAVRQLQVPAAFIFGDGDDRFGPGWIERLRETGRPVRVIEGANHFLDGEHEFDLLERVLHELRG